MPDSSEPNLEQFEIVAELLRRQDDVLQRLEELEHRIEIQINNANESRDSAELTESIADARPQEAA